MCILKDFRPRQNEIRIGIVKIVINVYDDDNDGNL